MKQNWWVAVVSAIVVLSNRRSSGVFLFQENCCNVPGLKSIRISPDTARHPGLMLIGDHGNGLGESPRRKRRGVYHFMSLDGPRVQKIGLATALWHNQTIRQWESISNFFSLSKSMLGDKSSRWNLSKNGSGLRARYPTNRLTDLPFYETQGLLAHCAE